MIAEIILYDLSLDYFDLKCVRPVNMGCAVSWATDPYDFLEDY